MEDTRTALEEFFRHFIRNAEESDVASEVAQFAASFLAAGPQGASCVRREDFAVVLPKRRQLFESAGLRSTEFVSMEAEALDARYSMARTRWKMRFESMPRMQEIVVDSTFVIDTGAQPFQIVLYLAHQDIMAILKERGILTA
jgi:hypothetical protein